METNKILQGIALGYALELVKETNNIIIDFG
jgi:hypothetical protein